MSDERCLHRRGPGDDAGTFHLLPVVCCLLPAACCLLPAACRLLPVAMVGAIAGTCCLRPPADVGCSLVRACLLWFSVVEALGSS